ncbi:MAG: SH3 domain-containing protein [Peptostreptococcaceae bacterium]|nr:SH3 domain-containing protein [Peptostreptococcaceae bacterium]
MKKNRLLALLCTGLLFMQIFAGCTPDGKKDKDQDVGETEQGQQTEEAAQKEEEQVSEEDLPSFIPLASETDENLYHLTVKGSVDLDFDGKEEELYFVADVNDYENDYQTIFGEFQLNGKSLDLRGLCKPLDDSGTEDMPMMLWNIEIIDLDKKDKQRELVVYKTKHYAGVPFFTAELFHYNKGKWKSLGEMDTDYRSSLEEYEYQQATEFDPDSRKLRFDVTGYFFCNFYHMAEYQLKDGKIRETTGEELAMFLPGEKGEREEILVHAKASANIYADPESEDLIYEVQPGDEIKLISCKIGEWVKVQTPQGEIGYFKYGEAESSGEEDDGGYRFLDNPGVSSWDVFEDLPAWG